MDPMPFLAPRRRLRPRYDAPPLNVLLKPLPPRQPRPQQSNTTGAVNAGDMDAFPLLPLDALASPSRAVSFAPAPLPLMHWCTTDAAFDRPFELTLRCAPLQELSVVCVAVAPSVSCAGLPNADVYVGASAAAAQLAASRALDGGNSQYLTTGSGSPLANGECARNGVATIKVEDRTDTADTSTEDRVNAAQCGPSETSTSAAAASAEAVTIPGSDTPNAARPLNGVVLAESAAPGAQRFPTILSAVRFLIDKARAMNPPPVSTAVLDGAAAFKTPSELLLVKAEGRLMTLSAAARYGCIGALVSIPSVSLANAAPSDPVPSPVVGGDLSGGYQQRQQQQQQRAPHRALTSAYAAVDFDFDMDGDEDGGFGASDHLMFLLEQRGTRHAAVSPTAAAALEEQQQRHEDSSVDRDAAATPLDKERMDGVAAQTDDTRRRRRRRDADDDALSSAEDDEFSSWGDDGDEPDARAPFAPPEQPRPHQPAHYSMPRAESNGGGAEDGLFSLSPQPARPAAASPEADDAPPPLRPPLFLSAVQAAVIVPNYAVPTHPGRAPVTAAPGQQERIFRIATSARMAVTADALARQEEELYDTQVCIVAPPPCFAVSVAALPLEVIATGTDATAPPVHLVAVEAGHVLQFVFRVCLNLPPGVAFPLPRAARSRVIGSTVFCDAHEVLTLLEWYAGWRAAAAASKEGEAAAAAAVGEALPPFNRNTMIAAVPSDEKNLFLDEVDAGSSAAAPAGTQQHKLVRRMGRRSMTHIHCVRVALETLCVTPAELVRIFGSDDWLIPSVPRHRSIAALMQRGAFVAIVTKFTRLLPRC